MANEQNNILLSCSRCGEKTAVSVPRSLNVREQPELKEEVRSGRLFVRTCPHCGTPNLIRTPFLYHDPDLRLMVWLSDGNAETERKMAAAVQAEAGLSDYTLRIVDTPGDLVEKINIAEAGLDDIAVEICKYVTRQELGRDVDLRFYRMEGADHDLTLAYPEKGQMQMVGIGFNVYEDSAAILGRNPELKRKATGLVRVDRRWLAQFLG